MPTSTTNRAPAKRLFGGQSESDLSPAGIAQLKELATAFRHLGISFQNALSSPAARARLGAEILLGEMGNPIQLQICPDLAERGSGIIAGKTREQLLVLHPELAPHLQRDPELRHLRESFEPTGIEGFEDYSQVSVSCLGLPKNRRYRWISPMRCRLRCVSASSAYIRYMRASTAAEDVMAPESSSALPMPSI